MSGLNDIEDVKYRYWIDKDGHLWKVESWCRYPTVTLVKMVSGPADRSEYRTGAVGCPNLQGIRPLVPKDD